MRPISTARRNNGHGPSDRTLLSTLRRENSHDQSSHAERRTCRYRFLGSETPARPTPSPQSSASSCRRRRTNRACHAFQIHQSLTEPEKFFFYEVFKDEAAFADHQQTDHFKTLIVGQAVPKLANRVRTQHRFV